MKTDVTKLLKLKEAARRLPISYSTLYRLSQRADGPFFPAFVVLGEAYFLDVEKFIEIGRREAERKALNDRG